MQQRTTSGFLKEKYKLFQICVSLSIMQPFPFKYYSEGLGFQKQGFRLNKTFSLKRGIYTLAFIKKHS